MRITHYLKIGDETIEIVNEYKYIGLLFTSNDNIKKTQEYISIKARICATFKTDIGDEFHYLLQYPTFKETTFG